jgi:hypothetical protein
MAMNTDQITYKEKENMDFSQDNEVKLVGGY